MGQIDITDFVTNLINSITDEKIINKADKTYVDDNFVLNTLFEEQINLKSDIDHNHDDRYYTESEMDIKLSEIESSIVGASGFSVSIVDVLPESGEFNTIYLVPSESPTENNKYNNYIWTGTEYDEIGGASPADIDLSDYATLEYLTSELSKYATIATLNTELSKKANNDHTHDTRYYTESEVDDKLLTKANNSLVNQSSDGLMSSADKVKLDGVADGANKTVVDSSLSTTSTNPVQNKIINTALSNKSNINHTHNSLSPTTLGSNVDFNDYKTEGTYVISWTNAQSATNIPNKTGGRLEVISVQAGVRQIYYNYGQFNSGLSIWWRNYYPNTDTWFDWEQIISTNNVDTALSSTSTNPVQNKIIYQELANKAPSSHTHSKLEPVNIPVNADLNDYKTQGSFYCPMNVTAATVGNTPSNQAFHLEVYKATSNSGKGVSQVAYSYRQDNVHIWWRNGYGGNWSEWYEVANKEDITSAVGDIQSALDKIIGV